MTTEKQEELKKLLVSADFKEDSYKELPIQEIIILKNSAKAVKENNEKDEKAHLFFEKREEFFNHMVLLYLQKAETMYAVFSKATNLPYVHCDEETCNDQIWMFTDERFAAKSAKELVDKKMEVNIVKLMNPQFLGFYMSLYSLGVNELLLDRGFNSLGIELETLVSKPDYEKLPPEKRPVVNPELVLTGIYFTQELRRKVENSEKLGLIDLEEEMLVNLERGRFIMPVQLPEGVKPEDKPNPKDIRITFLKMANGDIYQPLCTDPAEFQKFNKEKQFQGILVTYEKLQKMLVPNAKGLVLNPATLRLAIPKEKIVS